MPKRANVAIEPRSDGRWAVQTDGSKRADSLHERKTDAVARGRELAKASHTELVIKTQDGRIADRDSYRPDPTRVTLKEGSRSYTSKESEEVIKSSARVFESALKRLAKR